MIVPRYLRPGASRKAYLCLRCIRQRRHISQKFIAREVARGEEWNAWAKEIREGNKKSILSILEARGLVQNVTGDRKEVETLLIDKRIGAYVGIDPTAPSLHIGHLLPLMATFWMYIHGMHVVSLVGSSTAKIGDPTGRTSNRTEMSSVQRKANLASMHYQIKKLWINVEAAAATHGYIWTPHWKREIVENGTWWNKMPFLEVLKYLGTGMRMGAMLSRDTVKTKMESEDGMSFAEFCYPILQAWDWWHIYHEKNIQMQIGGSDQFGNIVAGVDGIKHIVKTHPDPDIRKEKGATGQNMPCGLTTPLLTTAAGEKFGKSAGNAIWLDQVMTPLFDLYGFFVRTADADVERYLKLFTFLPLPKIQSLMDKHKDDPSKRIPHHALAYEFVQMVHGTQAAKTTQAQHQSVFKKPTTSLLLESAANSPDQRPQQQPDLANQPASQSATMLPGETYLHSKTRAERTYISRSLNPLAAPTDHNTAPQAHITLPKSLVYDQPFAKVLHSAGLVASRSEGHRLCVSQGAYVGSRSSDRGTMADDLSWYPCKLKFPKDTYRYVIKDEEDILGQDAPKEPKDKEGLLLLRVGKWKIKIVKIVTDNAFEKLGLPDPPGWAERKEQLAEENTPLLEKYV